MKSNNEDVECMKENTAVDFLESDTNVGLPLKPKTTRFSYNMNITYH